MNFLQLLIVLILAVSAWFHFLSSNSRKPPRACKLPPGPYPLPIVGNIFQVGRNPHRSFANLSKTFGPLMSLQMGNVYTVIVSSPEIAKEILQKHDQVCSSRFTPVAMRAYDHHTVSVTCLSSGKEWRKLRKIFKEQLFSTHCLDASEGLRRENFQRLCDHVQKCCDDGQELNIGKAAFVTLLHLVSATLFSAEPAEFDSDTNQEWKETVNGIARYLGVPNIADFFPILGRIDPQGMKRKMERYFGKLLAFFDDIINERLKSRGASLAYEKKNDFLETLLRLREGSDYELTTKEIKHLLLDLIVAGTETSSSTAEWAMTELLLNPEKLKRAKHELRTVIGEKKQLVEESNISRLPYIQAVIKEVLRFHPPGPLFFPHKSDHDVEVSGYMIPKDTKLLINFWAIGRDPSLWPNPNSFEPERFLGRKIHFSGHDFEFIPFGSGRRICPGMPLADRMVHVMVANLIHNFDWKFEASAEAEKVHREEVFGLALQKRVPLKAIPINLSQA